jgi:DNA invertase Pin-like site-specific DNA recombinase
MPTHGYRRVSSDGQEDGTSLDHQTTKITGLAMMQELGEVTFFEDVCSGSIPLAKRDGGRKLLATLKPGDNVIVTKLDRVFRDATDALTQADAFKAQGINLFLIDMGTDPVTQNGTSRMFFGMLALMAEFERERIRERTADGRASKKARGGHVGGTRPFGYDVAGKGKDAVLVPREGEHEYIAEIMDRSKTQSLRAISAWLADKGITLSHVGVKGVIERANSRP